MKMYGVMLTEKNRIMKVLAGNEEQAQAEAERQLSRPGRYGILRQWEENGKMVKELAE